MPTDLDLDEMTEAEVMERTALEAYAAEHTFARPQFFDGGSQIGFRCEESVPRPTVSIDGSLITLTDAQGNETVYAWECERLKKCIREVNVYEFDELGGWRHSDTIDDFSENVTAEEYC